MAVLLDSLNRFGLRGCLFPATVYTITRLDRLPDSLNFVPRQLSRSSNDIKSVARNRILCLHPRYRSNLYLVSLLHLDSLDFAVPSRNILSSSCLICRTLHWCQASTARYTRLKETTPIVLLRYAQLNTPSSDTDPPLEQMPSSWLLTFSFYSSPFIIWFVIRSTSTRQHSYAVFSPRLLGTLAALPCIKTRSITLLS